MEIKYTRTYTAKNKSFTVGELVGLKRFAMEIVELRPVLEEGKLEPGEVCMLLFGITPAEYELRTSDEKKLNELADTLRKVLPKDRLISAMPRTLTGQLVQRPIKLRMGDSIDEGRFAEEMRRTASAATAGGPLDTQLRECRRLQQLCADKNAPEGVKEDWRNARTALGDALMELESLYVAFESGMQGKHVFVGFDGRVEMFTTKARFENAKAQFAKVNAGNDFWVEKEFKKAEIEGFFRACEGTGLYLLRVDNGFAAADLDLRDFRSVNENTNTELRGLILREIEYAIRMNALKKSDAPERNRNGALESVLTMRNFARRLIGNNVFYAICDLGSTMPGRHATSAAKKKLGDESPQVVPGDKTVMLGRKDTDVKHIAAFTDAVRAAAFAERLEGNPGPVAMTFDDLAQRSGECAGILVDPGDFGYIVRKEEYSNVLELRDKAPVAVRVKAPEPAQEAPKTEAPAQASAETKAVPQDNALPNPDAYDLPAAAEKAEAPAQAETEAKEEPAAEKPQVQTKPGKGFFRRLFGK